MARICAIAFAECDQRVFLLSLELPVRAGSDSCISCHLRKQPIAQPQRRILKRWQLVFAHQLGENEGSGDDDLRASWSYSRIALALAARVHSKFTCQSCGHA